MALLTGAIASTCRWLEPQCSCWWCTSNHLQMDRNFVQVLVVRLQPAADGSKLCAGAGGAPSATCKWIKNFRWSTSGAASTDGVAFTSR